MRTPHRRSTASRNSSSVLGLCGSLLVSGLGCLEKANRLVGGNAMQDGNLMGALLAEPGVVAEEFHLNSKCDKGFPEVR